MFKSTAASVLALSLLFSFGAVEAAKKPVKKPPVKKPAESAAIQTASQLPGGWGKLGVWYTIGKENKYNFKLVETYYSVNRVCIDTACYFPSPDEKLLVIRFELNNPLPIDRIANWNSIKLTAVAPDDTTREYIAHIALDGTSKALSQTLKPAQKIAVMTAIKVPAKGVIPKLIAEIDGQVVRYDIKDTTKALPAWIADPADAKGASVIQTPICNKDVFYPLGALDVKVVKAYYSNSELKLGEYAPDEGYRYINIEAVFKNMSAEPLAFTWDSIRAKVISDDGEQFE